MRIFGRCQAETHTQLICTHQDQKLLPHPWQISFPSELAFARLTQILYSTYCIPQCSEEIEVSEGESITDPEEVRRLTVSLTSELLLS